MVSHLLILFCLAAATPALAADGLDAAAGRALFHRAWISAPSSQFFDGGLGPLYDARSCNSCHAGGGAGRVGVDAIGAGMIVRLGQRDGSGDPVYGPQLQTHALPGLEPEADVNLHWQDRDDLRVAKIDFAQFHYGVLDTRTRAALRRAPSLFGLAQLASVPDAEILSRAGDHDDLHGRPSWVVDAHGHRALGRWGWKAGEADLAVQIDLAFQRDFGISTTAHPAAAGECTRAETQCVRAAPGVRVELPDSLRDLIVAYVLSLPAPPPRDETSAGFALFRRSGCLECHAVLTAADGTFVHAYSDLLLHDLGPGLDDGIAEGGAKAAEWRTAPLWDVAGGLAAGGLLHDGRARSIAEAVSWHGGEASRARAVFNALSSNDRNMLEHFLLGH